MTQKQKITLAAIASASIATTASLAEEISLDRVPANLRDIAANYAPGASFTSASIETEGGRRIYEIGGVNPDGLRVEIDLFEDGSLDEIEMEAREADLPAAVKSAVKAAQPKGTIIFVETSVHGDARFYYEVEVRLETGSVVAYEFAEDGRLISTEDDSATS